VKGSIKPGWYVLAALLLYALVVTLAWRHDRIVLHRMRAALAGMPLSGGGGALAGKYAMPLPGACLPRQAEHLPGYPRPYRKGVNQGLVFVSGDACVPVVYGAGVVADQDGRIIKAERDYQEMSAAEFKNLLKEVAKGASPQQMDKLRGREVWIEHGDGRVSVYAHLSGIRSDLRVGRIVKRGDWIGYVGNSGTQPAVRGTHEGARLMLEVWQGKVDGGKFLGQGFDPRKDKKGVLTLAEALFEVPPGR